jgi:hypothetical protein
MISKRLILCLHFLCGLSVIFSSGCVMKRTVTDGGSVVSEEYVVKRPLRDAMLETEEDKER